MTFKATMGGTIKHICVCVCTFKRPQLLLKLLGELQGQITDGSFTYSAVVVDNDVNQSAEEAVNLFKSSATFSVSYFSEPEQNIALARNKAIENSSGDYIAFMDDDEYPDPRWLLNLLSTCTKYEADGVLGPVLPYFEETPPTWLVNGNLCGRVFHGTGEILQGDDARTGNVLMKRDIFDEGDNRFDPKFGRSGGEDGQFFEKVIKKGKVFVWCQEACVHELVPPARLKKSFYLERSLRIGGLSGELMRKRSLRALERLPVSLAIIGALTLWVPVAAVFKKESTVKFLVKLVYEVGWTFGALGYVPIRFRSD